MNIKDLENKPMRDLSPDERAAIADAYLQYFDTLEPRERLLGYCVVYGGVPALSVGALDIGFRDEPAILTKCGPQPERYQFAGIAYSLWLGASELHIFDSRFTLALLQYLFSEPRLIGFIADKQTQLPKNNPQFLQLDMEQGAWLKAPMQWLKVPLFAPKIHGKGERLHDCRTFLANAGKAIGFNASKVKLYKLRPPVACVASHPTFLFSDGRNGILDANDAVLKAPAVTDYILALAPSASDDAKEPQRAAVDNKPKLD